MRENPDVSDEGILGKISKSWPVEIVSIVQEDKLNIQTTFKLQHQEKKFKSQLNYVKDLNKDFIKEDIEMGSKYMKNTPHQTPEKGFINLMSVHWAPRLASLHSIMRTQQWSRQEVMVCEDRSHADESNPLKLSDCCCDILIIHCVTDISSVEKWKVQQASFIIGDWIFYTTAKRWKNMASEALMRNTRFDEREA